MYDLDSCPHCRYYSLVFAIVSQWSRKGLFLFCNCINLLGLYDYLVLILTYPLECSLLKLSYPGGRCLSTVTFALHFSTSSLVYTKPWYQRALSIRRGSSQSIARTVTKKVATGAGCKYFLLPLRGNPPFRCFSFPDMIDLSYLTWFITSFSKKIFRLIVSTGMIILDTKWFRSRKWKRQILARQRGSTRGSGRDSSLADNAISAINPAHRHHLHQRHDRHVHLHVAFIF